MIIADGIVHPKELETLYRIGVESYGLTEKEIVRSIVSAGKTSVIPELPEDRICLLYEMALIAWADGVIEDSERNMLRRYAILYGIDDKNVDELVDYLLAKAKDNISEDKIIKDLNK